MSRGKRPVVTIGEAKRAAIAAGFMLIELISVAVLPCDFMVDRDGVTSIVRVRRLKQAGFRIENILRACAQQIRELRERTLMKGEIPELWVRGPARAFHRYRVLPDTVEEIRIAPQSPKRPPEPELRIRSYNILDDPIQRNIPSQVIEIPYVAGLPVKQEMQDSKSSPGSPDVTNKTAERAESPGPE
jgi:hypothetical protein